MTVKDMFNGDLTDNFIIVSSNQNYVFIRWDGFDPIDDSDKQAKITFV